MEVKLWKSSCNINCGFDHYNGKQAASHKLYAFSSSIGLRLRAPLVTVISYHTVSAFTRRATEEYYN